MGSIKAVVAGALGIVYAAAVAHAQTIDVNVPFAFHVQGVTLPAGHYELDTDTSSGVVMLRGERGNNAGVVVMTERASGVDPAGNKPSLTFSRYEDGYQLKGIWDSAHDGFQVAKQ